MRRMILLFASIWTIIFAADGLWASESDIGNMPLCKSCGMSRATFASSRTVIEYDDGSISGTCSLNCAAAEMALNPAKFPKAVWVADYSSQHLIDARKAVWVMGGKKEGVMSRNGKWAFLDREAADSFLAGNGGTLAGFDEVMKAAYAENRGSDPDGQPSHGSHTHPGELLEFNPAFGDQIYHIHPAGMWMVNYKFMHSSKAGLRSGTSNIDENSVSPQGHQPFGYMMTPTRMSMDMQMLMVMYGITDRLTVMAMGNYQASSMNMMMNMGMRNTDESPMRTNWLGDTDLAASFGLSRDWIVSLDVSFPTGDINQRIEMMGRRFRAPYDMQTGSGTFDLKPAVTYSHLTADALWNWGAQVSGVYHIDKNYADYALGDSIKATTWLQRAFGPAASWLRLAFTDTDRIRGRDQEIQKILNPTTGASTPDADPDNYGGQRLDALLGIAFKKGPFSFGVEAGLPVYEYLNGLQLKSEYQVTAGMQVMF